ncbi:metal-sensing transcriptional repressor, partial [Salmonella enterica subsp. enterica serovar Anatum]|nr:metal-sensing transcriptional repressor [Salmonella enterica subsp. enterica serovar Anatum]
ERALESGEPCLAILQQIAAVRGASNGLMSEMVEIHLKDELVSDVLQYFEMMKQGKVNGYICQGFNPVASFPNKNKVVASLSKLK